MKSRPWCSLSCLLGYSKHSKTPIDGYTIALIIIFTGVINIKQGWLKTLLS